MSYFKKLGVIFSCLAILITIFTISLISNQKEGIVIGCKGFQDEILAEYIAQIIEKNTTIPVIRKYHFGSTFIAYNALRSGEIDLYPEYSGSLLYGIFDLEEKLKPKKEKQEIQSILQQVGFEWLEPFGVKNSYQLVTSKKFAEKNNIWTIGALAEFMKEHDVRIGLDSEFVSRRDFQFLEQEYDTSFPYTLMESGLLYVNLNKQSFDVVLGNAMDDEVKRFDLVALEDDKQAFPSYLAGLIVKEDLFLKYPELKPVLHHLKNAFVEQQIIEMNFRVSQHRESVHSMIKRLL